MINRKLFERFRNAVAGGLIGMFLFTIAGEALPGFYFRFVDQTNFYTIEDVELLRDTYEQCDLVEYQISRTAFAPLELNYTDELVLVDSRFDVEVDRITGEGAAHRGQAVTRTGYPLPCNITPGEYYIQSLVTYEIEGSPRSTAYTTPTFTVLVSSNINHD